MSNACRLREKWSLHLVPKVFASLFLCLSHCPLVCVSPCRGLVSHYAFGGVYVVLSTWARSPLHHRVCRWISLPWLVPPLRLRGGIGVFHRQRHRRLPATRALPHAELVRHHSPCASLQVRDTPSGSPADPVTSQNRPSLLRRLARSSEDQLCAGCYLNGGFRTCFPAATAESGVALPRATPLYTGTALSRPTGTAGLVFVVATVEHHLHLTA